jgi:hypothetical protein
MFGQQHLLSEDAARLTEASGVEGLKAVVYELSEIGAALRPVIPNGLATQVV